MNKSPGKRLDQRVYEATDFTARRVTRRESLTRIVRGSAVVVAGATIGSFASVKTAMASVKPCTCHPPNGLFCTGCRSYGCPSSGSLCYDYYPQTGSWACGSGYGTCGNGYYMCYDCTTPYGHCHCGCKSALICGTCCSPAEVRAEMARVQREAVGAA